MEQKYPTREQAESIASNDCAHEICSTCDIEKWCAGDRVETIGAISASRRCGMSMLAMHDEIDRLKALMRDGECRWALDDADGDYNVWITDCGNAFIVKADGPEDNEMRYCPFCGKALVEVEAQQGREG